MVCRVVVGHKTPPRERFRHEGKAFYDIQKGQNGGLKFDEEVDGVLIQGHLPKRHWRIHLERNDDCWVSKINAVPHACSIVREQLNEESPFGEDVGFNDIVEVYSENSHSFPLFSLLHLIQECGYTRAPWPSIGFQYYLNSVDFPVALLHWHLWTPLPLICRTS